MNDNRSDNGKPYCSECGGDNTQYQDQYANGEEWLCLDCGKKSIYDFYDPYE